MYSDHELVVAQPCFVAKGQLQEALLIHPPSFGSCFLSGVSSSCATPTYVAVMMFVLHSMDDASVLNQHTRCARSHELVMTPSVPWRRITSKMPKSLPHDADTTVFLPPSLPSVLVDVGKGGVAVDVMGGLAVECTVVKGGLADE